MLLTSNGKYQIMYDITELKNLMSYFIFRGNPRIWGAYKVASYIINTLGLIFVLVLVVTSSSAMKLKCLQRYGF
jgi:hypothetical protein